MMTYRIFTGIVAISLLLTGSLAMAEEKLSIYTVNYPLQYFAQRIAGEQADVSLPVPAGLDPVFWQPDADTVIAYQQADLILLNGAGYAKWVSRVSLPRRKLVDTSAGFRDRYIRAEAGITHSHGREGDHSHSGVAFTTWLDFTLAVEQARAIATAFSKLRPVFKADFERNLASLEKDLLTIDEQIRERVAIHPDRALLASHPVYQYFKRRYGLNLTSVMWEPEFFPDNAQWSHLKQLTRVHPARWMIWEDNPDKQSVEALQAMDIASTVFNPCANRPEEGDFLVVMQQNVENLARAFKQ